MTAIQSTLLILSVQPLHTAAFYDEYTVHCIFHNKFGVVGSNLKMTNFFMQHLWMLHDVVVVGPGSCNNVAPGHTY